MMTKEGYNCVSCNKELQKQKLQKHENGDLIVPLDAYQLNTVAYEEAGYQKHYKMAICKDCIELKVKDGTFTMLDF